MGKVAVRPVDLHHRELRVVVGVHRLVPEVARDLENPLESPDDQALEIEFRSDPEEEVLVKKVMVGCERTGVGSAVDWLEDRGFELEKTVVVKVPADEGNDPAPLPEGLPALLVDNQVYVPLAVALFDIREPVELLRQGTDGLAQEREGIHPDRYLPEFCPEHVARYPDDIPPLDELVEEVELLLPDIVLPDVQLDFTTLITEVGKQGLAMVADNVDPAGRGHGIDTLVMGDIRVFRLDLGHRVLPVKGRREYDVAFLLQCTDFVKPCLVESCIFGWTAHRENTRVLG